MKKIINGKKYDTDTAREVDSYQDGYCGDFHMIAEWLHRKRTGEFFVYGKSGAAGRYGKRVDNNSWRGGSGIRPLSIEEAKRWIEKHSDAETYEQEFGECEE